MRKKTTSLLCLFLVVVALGACSDLFAKQKAIKFVQNYRAGKNTINFKSWLEDRKDSSVKTEITWEAGRLKKGLWVVQITFQSERSEERFLYLVDLVARKIRGADNGLSEQTLKEFEESAPEYI